MRPQAAADLVDALRAVVPARVQKKLEASGPETGNPAEGWTWGDGTVTTDSGETVTLTGPEPITVDGIRCSCLLSPKCLHVLAVAAALPTPAVEAPVPVGPKRPTPSVGLMDAVRAAVPARVQKKLEAGNPADGWTWTESGTGWTVVTTDGDTVTLGTTAEVGYEQFGCTCLLGPRCFHVLAVASAMAAGPGPSAVPAAPPVVAEAAPPPDPAISLDRGQKGVAAQVQRAAVTVLLAGATGVGPTARDDLVRAVHGARATGLHRLAKAGNRVLRQVRDLQKARPEFALDDLVEDLRELLLVARVLTGDQPTASYLGTARREYDPVGTLRLFGILTEPILGSAGYAGVSTLLCDATGRLWTVSDVRPGDPLRASARYDGSAEVGGLTLSHRLLGRSGLFAQNATASDDGRLGTGGGVKAVRSGTCTWADAGPAHQFATPVPTQLDRVFSGRQEWVFLRGRVLGAHEDALLFGVDGLSFPVRLVAPTDHPVLRYRDNLRLLSQSPGLPLEVVGKPEAGRRGTVAVFSVGAGKADDPEAPALAVPTEWVGRCNLGFDLLAAGHVERGGRKAVELEVPEAERPDPLDPVRRRVARLALGGRGTLPGDARGAVEREGVALRERMMPNAARVLADLADASAAARTEGGDRLTVRWLAAAQYLASASRSLQRAGWR